jgi:hypothetical protein
MSQSSNYIGDMFAEHTLEFQEKFIDGNLIAGTISDSHFGILNLKALRDDHNNLSHDFVFMVDRSASMEDRCGDGKTKMQHICHILKNMVSYFKEHPTIRAHITICTFDDVCDTVLERVVITDTILAKLLPPSMGLCQEEARISRRRFSISISAAPRFARNFLRITFVTFS